MTFKDRIGRDIYTYEEDRPINWKISSETTKIGDYKVQKQKQILEEENGRHGLPQICLIRTDLINSADFQDLL
jgi:hypothetical protein